MHFNYSDYPGTAFFYKWCKTIADTCSPVQFVVLGLFLAVILYYTIRGSKKERTLFLGTTLVMVVTVLNPWSSALYYKILDVAFAHRVFRYFWMLPVYLVIAYFVADVAFKFKGKFMALRYIFLGLFFVGGTAVGITQVVRGHGFTYGGKDGFTPVQNIYKIQQDVVDAVDMIEADKGSKDIGVNVLFDMDVFMEIRSYDASMLAAHGSVYGGYINSSEETDAYIANGAYTTVLAAFVYDNFVEDAISYGNLKIALEQSKTQYIIIKSEYSGNDILDNMEISCLGETNSGNYRVYKVPDVIEDPVWQARLYSPTMIQKIGDRYFINDTWHHRIIFSDTLDKNVNYWNLFTEKITGGHSLSSDGELFICDDTDGNALRVFKANGSDYTETQVFEDLCYRPHYTAYDSFTGRFYVIGSNDGEIFVFENRAGVLEMVNHIVFDGMISGYTRSFAFIDDFMYIVGPSIYKVDYRGDWSIVEEFKLPDSMAGSIALSKVNDYYYLSTYTDASGNINPGFVRTKDLAGIINGNYEDIYSALNLKGAVYFMSCIDGRYYLPIVDMENGFVTFDLVDDSITNVSELFYHSKVTKLSLLRRWERYAGWYITDGRWRFRNKDGSLALEWLCDGGFWYYMGTDGYMVANHFMDINGKSYYFDVDGRMVIGWNEIRGDWYYMDDSGAMVKDAEIDGYKLGPDGKMVK